MESGVVGKTMHLDGSRKKYLIVGENSTAYPVSKATYDYLEQVDDERSPSEVASMALRDYQRTLDRRVANYDPITPLHRKRLEALTADYQRAEEAAKPEREARRAKANELYEARQSAAKIEGHND